MWYLPFIAPPPDTVLEYYISDLYKEKKNSRCLLACEIYLLGSQQTKNNQPRANEEEISAG